VTNNATLVSHIDLPDGTSYVFTYEPTQGSAGFVTGRLKSVTLPTGGSITYAYANDTSNGITCADGSAGFLKRTTNPGGVWKYQRALVSGTQWTTTITDPASKQSVLNFQDIYETSRTVYNGSITAAVLQTVLTCYNGNTTNCDTTTIGLPITQRTVTNQLPDASGKQSQTAVFYDGTYGLVTKVDEYDFKNGATFPLARRTLITYATDIGGIADKPASVKVFDPANLTAPVSQTTYTYDGSAAAGSGITTQHTTVTCTGGFTKCRGNLTSSTYLIQGTTNLSRTFTNYDTGNIKTVVDVNAPFATTTYTYDSSTSCAGAFPTTVTQPIATLSRSMAWDCKGGVMTSVTDENGKIANTNYADANFWRPTSVVDFGLDTTTLTYGTSPTSVESTMNFNGSVSTVDVLTTFDGFGRVQFKQRKQVPGAPGTGSYDSVGIAYDNLGRPYQSSMPYQGTAGQSIPVGTPMSTTTYDPLNRVKSIVDGGAGTVNWTFTNNNVLSSVMSNPESNKQRQLEYDGLGRLTSVCEITSGTGTGSCAQTVPKTGYWTKYTYNVLNQITGVTQNAQSTTNKQTRAYFYDGLGRVTSETNPETNNLSYTYTYDTDTTCGTSNGDLVKRVDMITPTNNVTCYAYDKLHRLTGITYPTGSYASATPAKCFVYDTATVNSVAMTNVAGRLAEAYTGTGTSCPIATKTTDLGFSYSAKGQVADVYQKTPHSPSYYHVSASYWAHGLLKTLTPSGMTGLPTINYGGTGTTGLDGEGRLTQVTASSGQSPVTSVTYETTGTTTAPVGALTKATLGSADSDSFQYDPNTGRMTQYKLTAGASQSVTGVLGWNANGMLTSLNITDQVNTANSQNCAFGYDNLVRNATVDCGSTIWKQNFTYDPYGNITKAAVGTGVSFASTYSATTAATNRLTQIGTLVPTYDGQGNLTYDTVHSYSWDADGKMLSVDSTAVNLTYDALGRMVEQNRGGVYTEIVYSPTGQKLALMNGSTVSKALVPLPGGGTAVYASGTTGPLFYRHSDWLGSSRLATTQSRTKYFDVSYAPFGENYKDSGTADYSFTGQNQDTMSQYYDFLFREYSQVEGRWLSPDPAGMAAVNPANPQSWNRYAYVMNAPLLLTDPLGLKTPKPCHQDDDCPTPPQPTAPSGPPPVSGNACWDPATGAFRAPCVALPGRLDDGRDRPGGGGDRPEIGPAPPEPKPCQEPFSGAIEVKGKLGPEVEFGPIKVGMSLYKDLRTGETGSTIEFSAGLISIEGDNPSPQGSNLSSGGPNNVQWDVNFFGARYSPRSGEWSFDPAKTLSKTFGTLGVQVGGGIEFSWNSDTFTNIANQNKGCQLPGGTILQ